MTDKCFKITTCVHKRYLGDLGFDTSKVTDAMMKKIAQSFHELFNEQVLEQLENIAEDMGIPKRATE